MTDSEARTLTVGWASTPSSEAEHQADEQAILRRKQEIENLTLATYGKAKSSATSSKPLAAPKQKKSERTLFVRTLDGLAPKEYCQRMHDAGLETPPSWQKWKPNPCPADYLVAWNLPNNALRKHFLSAVQGTERKNARRD
jgi:hypothetical protein